MIDPEQSNISDPIDVTWTEGKRPPVTEADRVMSGLEHRRAQLETVAAWHRLDVDTLLREMAAANYGDRLNNAHTKGKLLFRVTKENHGDVITDVPPSARIWNAAENALDALHVLRRDENDTPIDLDLGDAKPMRLMMRLVPQHDTSIDIELRAASHPREVGVISVSPYDGDRATWRFYDETAQTRILRDEYELTDTEAAEFFTHFDTATLPIITSHGNTEKRLERNTKWARFKGIRD